MASRSSSAETLEEKDSGKPACKYGAECYRTNPQHLAGFWHPQKGKRKTPTQDEDEIGNVPKNKMRKCEPSSEQEPAEPAEPAEEQVPREDDEKIQIVGLYEEGEDPWEWEKEDDDTEDSESDEDEDLPLPDTPPNLDPKEEIRWKFKTEMPDDFYDFWEFCQSLDKKHPKDALKSCLGLQLVGPYDILSGDLKRTSQFKRSHYCLHWRYYYDPPEFQTVIRGDDETQHHLGYYRDEPSALPAFVAANSAKISCTITPQGDNIFAAVKLHMDKLCKATKDKAEQNEIQSLQKPLAAWAKKCGHSLEPKTQTMKARDKKVVTKTFHGAGIVVPVDTNDVGYRELPETDASLKRIFKKIADSKNNDERNKNLEPLDEIMSFVQFANDECDYGEGYELGIDLFAYGSSVFHPMVKNILPLAYTLLDRGEFGKILKMHLKDRRMDDLAMI